MRLCRQPAGTLLSAEIARMYLTAAIHFDACLEGSFCLLQIKLQWGQGFPLHQCPSVTHNATIAEIFDLFILALYLLCAAVCA